LSSSALVPDIPVFPANVLSVPTQDAAHNVPMQHSATSGDLGASVVDGMRQSDNVAADIARAMSAAQFASSSGNKDDDGAGHDVGQDFGTGDSREYGTDGTGSMSPSVNSIHDNVHDTGEGDSINTNQDDLITAYDGIHSDLFENLFQTLPVDTNEYRALGTNLSGLFGQLLLPEQDHPAASPVLDAHVDDGIFLSQQYHYLTFEQRADLLYIHWDTLQCTCIQFVARH
jgi:hypothetical protein